MVETGGNRFLGRTIDLLLGGLLIRYTPLGYLLLMIIIIGVFALLVVIALSLMSPVSSQSFTKWGGLIGNDPDVWVDHKGTPETLAERIILAPGCRSVPHTPGVLRDASSDDKRMEIFLVLHRLAD